jgi:hypothetical protein
VRACADELSVIKVFPFLFSFFKKKGRRRKGRLCVMLLADMTRYSPRYSFGALQIIHLHGPAAAAAIDRGGEPVLEPRSSNDTRGMFIAFPGQYSFSAVNVMPLA